MFKKDKYRDVKGLSKAGCGVGVVVLIAVVALVIALSSTTQVKYGTVKMVTRFGALTGRVLQPGFHWKAPLVDGTITMPTVIQSYETSDNPKESKADFTDYPVSAQTIDGQQVSVKYTVIFRVPAGNATSVVQDVGPMKEIVENVVKARSRNLSRLIAQSYTAEDLYSGDGIFDYQTTVGAQLADECTKYGIVMDDFLVRKIDFSAEYVDAIENQQIAQEAIETARYNSEAAEYEKQKTIRQAEAEAERTKLQAEADAEKTKIQAAADAERTRLEADAEAYSIEARGKALRQNPELVQWEFVKNLDDVKWGILPDNGVTPLLPVPTGE